MMSPARLRTIGWWLGLLVCAFYGAYALYMGVEETLSLLGLVDDAPYRAAPVIFVMHALAGGVALIVGPLQFNTYLRTRWRAVHRVLGRVYVGAIWIGSAGGLWVAITLDASAAARAGFGALAVLWFATTTIALLRIRRRSVAVHREWMIRSFALSLFFVTFSLWVPGVASANGRYEATYALGVWLTWGANLLVAEAWIRLARRPSGYRRSGWVAN